MYDTIDFMLTRLDDVGVCDFVEHANSSLSHLITDERISLSDGLTTLIGRVENYTIVVNPYCLKVKNGSLCRWLLGSNIHSIGRKETEQAVKNLSDTLHVDMSAATVTRFDVASNLIMKHPPEVYFKHLGTLNGARIQPKSNGLIYFQSNWGQLEFYDKKRERADRGEQLPEMYRQSNILRYEQRYLRRVAKKVNEPKVTASMLYDEAFYVSVLKRWRETYRRISKVNEINLNIANMTGKKDLYRMGILALIEVAGGINAFNEQLNEAQKSGVMNRKQAYDLRKAVQQAYDPNGSLTVKSDVISELDKKIDETIAYYR